MDRTEDCGMAGKLSLVNIVGDAWQEYPYMVIYNYQDKRDPNGVSAQGALFILSHIFVSWLSVF